MQNIFILEKCKNQFKSNQILLKHFSEMMVELFKNLSKKHL